MNKFFPDKRAYILIGSMTVFVAALFFGANILLRRFTPPPSVPGHLPPINERDSQRTNIVQPSANPKEIIYTANGFQPDRVTINASDPFGCQVSVANMTQEQLKVGVSPHSEKGDPGADYGDTPPGERSILDARYPGFAETPLHNHYRPSHGFVVVFGEGCR